MKDFHYYAPTEVVFGKNSEKEIGRLARRHGANKVLVHYGGKSAQTSGLLDVVRKQLHEAEMGSSRNIGDLWKHRGVRQDESHYNVT